jgi:hypothetical protein
MLKGKSLEKIYEQYGIESEILVLTAEVREGDARQGW